MVLPLWDVDEETCSLLASFAAAFPLRRPSYIATPDMARYLLTRSEGTIGELAQLLTVAAVVAIESGEEAIDRRTLTLADYAGPSERRRVFEAECVRLPQRWPLHPQPSEGESLSSWLSRVARCYRMGLQDLLEHDLGHGRLDGLDMAPPAALWDTLERRSGLAPERLRSMTLAGLTPWLLDGVDPDPDSGAYDLYVGQLSVLLPAGRCPSRVVPGWRAWVPRQPILRACPRCLEVSGNQALLLHWQLPVSVGCPAHGCRLETYGGTPGNFLGWASEDTQPRALPDVCAAMDRRTWHALTHGYVDLPRRRVHVGVWFRLLRSLVEDVLAPRSQHRAQGPDLCLIWERSGHPVRGV